MLRKSAFLTLAICLILSAIALADDNCCHLPGRRRTITDANTIHKHTGRRHIPASE